MVIGKKPSVDRLSITYYLVSVYDLFVMVTAAITNAPTSNTDQLSRPILELKTRTHTQKETNAATAEAASKDSKLDIGVPL